jgi:hypothetical protein
VPLRAVPAGTVALQSNGSNPFPSTSGPSWYAHGVTSAEHSSDKLWNYRFSHPDGSVVGTEQYNGDAAAEEHGRELSKTEVAPIVIHRHSGHVDAWEYVTEVDERP